MVEITDIELKKNIDKYIGLGQREEIVVTVMSKPVFTIVPNHIDRIKNWRKLFDTLPPEAVTDKDIDRE